MGTLKSILIGTERSYLTSDWAELTFDPTSKFSPSQSVFFFKKNKSRFIIKKGVFKKPRITDRDRGVIVAWKLHCDGWGPGVAPIAKKDPTDTKDINTILLSLKKIAADAKSESSAGNASNANIANGSPEAAGKR